MKHSIKDRMTMIDKAKKPSIQHQCELLAIPRSTYYYTPKKASDLNLKLMRLIDEKHLLHPWLGVPRITTWLNKDMGFSVNKKRVERLFVVMGINAIGPKPNTSKKGQGPAHAIYSYLLKDLVVARPNHVWATDISYIPVQGGHLYLCAIIDLYSRFVLNWSLSNTMTSSWCRETLEEAVQSYGTPEILNTDQGSQFTAHEYAHWVTDPQRGIRLSMDGKGRAIDNIFIERLWRSVKYEHVYLCPASDGVECYKGLKNYFEYYNHERRHQSIDNETPFTFYQHFKKSAI